MSISKAYNSWASSYDDMVNKTRDLEEKVAKSHFLNSHFETILELGCGTGKNTIWLVEKCDTLIAFDFSEEMLEKAKEKIQSKKVIFQIQDLNENWKLPENSIDLICGSLVLEHIENLDLLFKKASTVLKQNGQFYISELHPFKQYSGSKARFDDGSRVQELEVYVHHLTDYTEAALKNAFKLIKLKECFDEDDRNTIPRLISFVFQKE